jgi:VWFA-related protein
MIPAAGFNARRDTRRLRLTAIRAVRARWAVVVLAVTECASSLTAAHPAPSATVPTTRPACAAAVSAPAYLASQPNYSQVVVSVRSTTDLPLPAMTVADLDIYQGTKQLQVVFLQPQPATIGILVDNSGSMQPKLEQCTTALSDFIHDLNAQDEIFIDTFSDRAKVLVPPTTRHDLAAERLGAMRAFGRTALYDAIAQGLQTAAGACSRNKALVVLTDGMDSASASTAGQIANQARTLGIPIYSIGIGEPVRQIPYMGYGPGHNNPFVGAGQNSVDMATLTTLSVATGGQAYLVHLGAPLKQATRSIAARIGDQYIIGFIGDGSITQLRITAPNHKQLAFRIQTP